MAASYLGRHRFGQPGLMWCRAQGVSAPAVQRVAAPSGWARLRSFFGGRRTTDAPLRATTTIAHRAASHAAPTVRLGRAA